MPRRNSSLIVPPPLVNFLPGYNPGPQPGGGPMPLTPQQRAAFNKADKLEMAAKAAKAKGDYARAEAYYRAETQVPHHSAPPWDWVDLGLVLDHQGKRSQAFMAYQRGLGPANGRAGPGLPIEAEADARFGLMCEDRGLHGDACECYYAWRTKGVPEDMRFLDYTLNPATTSSSLVRSLLNAALGVTLEQERPQPNPEAMAAFHAAVRLTPGDPRPWYFLAYGFRRAGRFAEAEAALGKVSQLDKNGRLKAAVEKSLEEVRSHLRRW